MVRLLSQAADGRRRRHLCRRASNSPRSERSHAGIAILESLAALPAMEMIQYARKRSGLARPLTSLLQRWAVLRFLFLLYDKDSHGHY